MALPKIHVYVRCYVKDRRTLQTLKKTIRKAIAAKKKSDCKFNLYIAYGKKLSNNLREEVMNASKPLIENGITVLEAQATGPGNAFIDILEEGASVANIDRSKFVFFIVDGDGQFPIEDDQFLQDIEKLARSVLKEDVLLGLGLRTKITLGKGKFATYREADEMLHTLFIRRQLKLPNTKKLDIPRHYKELGDAFSGCYCINPLHDKYPQLLKEIIDDGVKSDLTNCLEDFYVVMKISQLSKIVSEIIETDVNPPGQFKLDNIKLKTMQLLATSLKDEYSKFLHSKNTWRILEKYFSSEDIQFVKNMVIH